MPDLLLLLLGIVLGVVAHRAFRRWQKWNDRRRRPYPVHHCNRCRQPISGIEFRCERVVLAPNGAALTPYFAQPCGHQQYDDDGDLALVPRLDQAATTGTS